MYKMESTSADRQFSWPLWNRKWWEKRLGTRATSSGFKERDKFFDIERKKILDKKANDKNNEKRTEQELRIELGPHLKKNCINTKYGNRDPTQYKHDLRT